jgi:hypothetical protein
MLVMRSIRDFTWGLVLVLFMSWPLHRQRIILWLMYAAWFTFLVTVIAFGSGLAAWIWLLFGPGPG